jgi:signal transduction histidine kinase
MHRLPRATFCSQHEHVDSADAVTGVAPPVVKEEIRKLTPPPDVEPNAFLASALAPADQARERLLSFMVHEIRNPLASTLWSVEMLAKKSLGDPRNDRLAQLATRSIRRLRALIEDLFALERVPMSPGPGRTDLRAAVYRAMSPHDLEPAGVNASVDALDSVPVSVDPVLLDRLLHTCLRRLAHVGSEGPVVIRLTHDESTAVLSMAQRGATVPDVDPPPLTSGGSEGAGTVFSLLVARAIAQRLGIALWVEPAPDGAAVRLGFPLDHRTIS